MKVKSTDLKVGDMIFREGGISEVVKTEPCLNYLKVSVKANSFSDGNSVDGFFYTFNDSLHDVVVLNAVKERDLWKAKALELERLIGRQYVSFIRIGSKDRFENQVKALMECTDIEVFRKQLEKE